MSSTILNHNRSLFNAFRKALYDCEPENLAQQLETFFAPDAQISLAHPLGNTVGAEGLYQIGYAPLLNAIPDLERRDFICLTGADKRSGNWIGTGGYYVGVFEKPWLKIPATRHIVTVRYIEFFKYENDLITEMYALWDIPDVMMQARAWPMSPSLGREITWPSPATQDGIVSNNEDAASGEEAYEIVESMLGGLQRHAEHGPEGMGMEQYWHPHMNWYGPSGIGSNRRISGFRRWHQIPFLNAMPDRKGRLARDLHNCYFAEGNYVAYCGWPALDCTLSDDGWLGIAPSGKEVTVRSLDFWRCENGLIRENWVMVDVLDVYNQLGVDVLARMEDFTVDRQTDFGQI